MGIKTQIKAKDLESNNQFNISLLGFKMAITEGLTVFNLIDGIVDEFEDESGTDASASTSLTYNSTDDYYINSTTSDGSPLSALSAGFTTTSITEPDTSTAGTNPALGSGTFGTFTVPTGFTSINVFTWGSGGASGGINDAFFSSGGGGGFASGILSATPSQTFRVVVGEGGGTNWAPNTNIYTLGGGAGGSISGPPAMGSWGGGLSGVFVNSTPIGPAASSPQVYVVGAGGGGGGFSFPDWPAPTRSGGAGGGLTGDAGGQNIAQTTEAGGPAAPQYASGGGGSQSTGGNGGAIGDAGAPGTFLRGGLAGEVNGGGGGSGYYGGGGSGGNGPGGTCRSGGGGSSYYGNPQISSGSTEDGCFASGGGTSSPFYVAATNEGATAQNTSGEDGYVLLTAAAVCASATSSTIISDPFNANVVPTTSRIVVFEENVGTPTLNTDVIASVSRNNGSNFTTVTLTDSGYVTGSSGQRILTGQADISGQPSGQSMKWKLQLANQTVKIHGVSLQWS